jgi:hypothetical protein
MSILLGAAFSLPTFLALLHVTLAVSGPRECVATIDVNWMERSGMRKFIAEIRTVLEPSGLSPTPQKAPIIPRERFSVVLSSPVAGESGVPAPTMTIESSIEDGVVSPSREEFDAAVAIAAEGFVRTLAERTPASGPGSPTEAGVDQAKAKAIVGNLAAILRERLESGEASQSASPQPGSALPSILILSTTVQSLAPPWWALILPMVGGPLPLALAWRSGRWGTGSPAERWIMPEARGWGRIG